MTQIYVHLSARDLMALSRAGWEDFSSLILMAMSPPGSHLHRPMHQWLALHRRVFSTALQAALRAAPRGVQAGLSPSTGAGVVDCMARATEIEPA